MCARWTTLCWGFVIAAPDMREYAGFELDGQLYVFTVPAFGLAPVPRICTALEEVYLRVREQGVRMTYMIDDQANWAGSVGQAAAQCHALVRLLATLGFYLRPDKCQLRPQQQVRFLGLIADTATMVFRVLDGKLQRISAEARKLLQQPRATPRELARIAGQLLSFTPAVDLAPLLARGLFLFIRGKPGWDEGSESTSDLVVALRWCVEAVPRYNGTRMIKRGPALQLVLTGDASEVGMGIFTPNGELLAAGLSVEIVTSWDAEQLRRLAANDFSSTLREIIALRLALECLAEKAPQLLRHRWEQYQTDSHAAMGAVNGMGGNASLYPEVAALWRLCKELDCELFVVWHPREDTLQQRADELSKLPDGSAWAIDNAVFTCIDSKLHFADPRCRRAFTVDLFADERNARAPHFFSRWCCPGTSGIDSFAQRWDWYWCTQQRRWRRHMGYCNGPFDCMGRILRKVIDEQADVALVYPMWPRAWQVLLQQLRTSGAVKQAFDPPRNGPMFWAGALVPLARKGTSFRDPKYRVLCGIILWDQPGTRPKGAPRAQ